MSAQREMTLDEWMARLPESHTANRELAALRARLAELEAERDRLRERVYDLNGISMSLAADLLRFIGEDESREADCLRARIVGWRRQWDEISTRAALQEGK